MRSEGYVSCPVCVCVSVCRLLIRYSRNYKGPTDSVSWSLQNMFGVFRIMASFSKIAIASHSSERTVVGHFYTGNGLILRIPSVYYARGCTRAVNLYAHE